MARTVARLAVPRPIRKLLRPPLRSAWKRALCSATEPLARCAPRSPGSGVAQSSPWSDTRPREDPAPPGSSCHGSPRKVSRTPSRSVFWCRASGAPTTLGSSWSPQSRAGKPGTQAIPESLSSLGIASSRESNPSPGAVPKLHVGAGFVRFLLRASNVWMVIVEVCPPARLT